MKKELMLLLLCVMAFLLSNAQSSQRPSPKQAKRWFKKKEWTAGFAWKPHASINKTELAYQYAAHKSLWQKTFAFLNTHNLATLEKGDYKLAGDSAVVKVSYGAAKNEADAKWETHRKFIDVQLVGAGSEMIGVEEAGKTKLTRPYDEAKDIANHEAKGKYYIAKPGTFFIFFPADAHRPGIKVDEGQVRKIVVKILAAE
jgi:YhcH/YjgK/YiaL family protein